VRQLPDTKTATADLRSSGKLEVVYVATDTPDTAEDMKRTMREVGFTYPNLYNGSFDFAENFLSWKPGGNHHNYLINPQGLIVAKDLYMPELKEVLAHFVNAPESVAPIGLRVSAETDGAGGATLRAELTSPDRLPLTCTIDYAYIVAVDGGDTSFVDPGGEQPEFTDSVTFGEWSDQAVERSVPAHASAVEIRYQVRVLIPGTEALAGGEGVWATERGRVPLSQ
jgi:hypothetical protein